MTRDERLLRARIQRVLLLALGACSSTGAATGGDAGLDATAGEVGEGGGSDADTDAAHDAGNDDAADAGNDDAGAAFPTCADASVSAPYYDDAGPDGACYVYIDYSCPLLPPMGTDCHLSANDCITACAPIDAGIFECLYLPTSCAHGTPAGEAGAPIKLACSLCPGGRRPSGLARSRCRASSAVGAFFAQAAHLEAASVVAFDRLAEDLREHGAPARLVRMAERAARDESRHARRMTRLARRFGAEPPAPDVGPRRSRSLERIAMENEVEGCVRETFGAVVAAWQGSQAADADVRRAMSAIAVDETRHAALAHEVSRWAARKLDAGACARIARARRAEVRRLSREASAARPAALVRHAGLPAAPAARALLSGMLDA